MNLLSKFIASAIALLSPCTAFAAKANTVTIEDMKNYLVNVGIPETHIACLDDDKIKNMFERLEGKYVIINETETSYLYINNEVSPYSGTIKEADMYLSITTSVICNDKDKKDISSVQVSIDYEWLHLPTVYKTDAAIVNWDSNVFTYEENTFYSYNHAINANNLDVLTTTLLQPTELLQNSLGYTMQLPNAYNFNHLTMYGHAGFALYPAKNPTYNCDKNNLPSSYNTTSINVQYRHNGNPFWANLGLSVSGVSISFTLDTLTYTTARNTNIFYNY